MHKSGGKISVRLRKCLHFCVWVAVNRKFLDLLHLLSDSEQDSRNGAVVTDRPSGTHDQKQSRQLTAPRLIEYNETIMVHYFTFD